ncbi:LytTR family DNA-binding domain-containing protein [Oceanicoccus sp. KOV_DT_Chl]|uniref:LytR/AlgR family response regulator transcription factor n=1 Tax=Oceanicoccus sp. KOV_DT_Chl TaxID=1904639 RepID=UPI000C7C408D|nr:LytTR family DNA-binding domain-containing protein [Oceanicoccus sp. KOV_DT_Chl]
MKVLIVDDEPLARTRLVRLLEQQGGYEVVAEADNGEQAIAACNEHEPDVLLMDIRMPVMDGLQAARHLAGSEQPPAVIFCTAYNDYALDAFEANAVDYLLKPVNREKLALALAKAQKLNRVQISALIESSNQQDPVAANSQRQHISAKTSRGIELIPVEQVRYFLADQKYVTVYYVTEAGGALKEVLIDDPLKELEREFTGVFVRIHRNALVAVQHIQGLEKTDEGMQLKLAGAVTGPIVSRRHQAEVRKLLHAL